jgi:hypothetical protein
MIQVDAMQLNSTEASTQLGSMAFFGVNPARKWTDQQNSRQ